MENHIKIRQASTEDIPEITAIFRNTILSINSKDYSEPHITIWILGAHDIKKWEARIEKFYFIVAEINHVIIGFSYLKNGNYLDGLFVHKDYQRQGIASKMLRIIESHVMINEFEIIKSDVSITALPFFDNHDYNVVKKQNKNHKGLIFENYIVEKRF